MEIKEMPLEEKYDKLLDGYLLSVATNYALHKELRTVDKWLDYIVKVQKKMFPSWLGIALKVLKTITPGRVFKQVVDRGAYQQQIYHPLSSIEVTMVSDREMVGRIKNCVPLKRMKDLVRKAGLDLDPKFICEADSKIFPELFKEFGIDVTMELEENGCIFTAKLK